MSDSTGYDHSKRLFPPTIAMGGGSFEEAADGSAAPRRHPEWIKARIPSGETYQEVRRLLHGLALNTVCEEAHCPNMGECWDARTATVMILGDTCTRACGFCAVKTGKPLIHDLDEPRRVAEAIRQLSLDHVVVTSVARDDLDDGGAGIFAETIRRLRDACPGMGVEVLIPDFNGEEEPLRTVMAAGPDILNHNVETVARLQKPVRKRARYDRSLGVLLRAKAYAAEFGRGAATHTKSSIMVGLGETRPELRQTFLDLRAVDCDVLTIGQYLRPSAEHLPVVRYYHPDEFAEMREEALAMGFRHVESGPLVRSSYHARDQVPDAEARRAARAAGVVGGVVAESAAPAPSRPSPTIGPEGRIIYRPDRPPTAVDSADQKREAVNSDARVDLPVRRDWLERLPKVELHLHLEGATPHAALWQLICKYGGDPTVQDAAALPGRFVYRDFPDFIDRWNWKQGFIREAGDFELIGAAVAGELARQRIVYAEAFYTPADVAPTGMSTQEVSLALRRGLASVAGVEVALIADLCRDYGPAAGARTLEEVAEVAAQAGVIGIGIGGSEQSFPPEPFAAVYERARALGLRTTAHAGEAAGPESVWGAISALGVDRIDHGLRAVEDPALVAYLAERRLPVTACPGSNVATGAVASIERHPIRRFMEAGVVVSVGTDDPAMFGLSLAGEMAALQSRLAFTDAEVRTLLLNAVESCWVDGARRADLRARLLADPTWIE